MDFNAGFSAVLLKESPCLVVGSRKSIFFSICVIIWSKTISNTNTVDLIRVLEALQEECHDFDIGIKCCPVLVNWPCQLLFLLRNRGSHTKGLSPEHSVAGSAPASTKDLITLKGALPRTAMNRGVSPVLLLISGRAPDLSNRSHMISLSEYW